MKFEISEKQLEKLKVWQEAVKTVYGEHGEYKYTFTPTGIGDCIEVYSSKAKASIDLTDIDDW